MKSKDNKKTMQTQVSFYSKKLEKEITLSGFSFDEDNANLLKAKVEIGDDLSSYICLKVPNNMTLEQMIKLKMFEGLDVLNKYEGLDKDKFNHLGNIERNYDKLKNYYLVPPKKDELDYVEEHFNSKSARRKQFEKELQEQVKQHSNLKEIERLERIANPTLSIIDIELEKNAIQGFETYMYLQGVDLSTGQILEINKAHFRNVEDKYLYTAYINVVNEQRSQKGIIEGYPVIFELPKTLKQSIEDNEIRPILELLQVNEKSHLKEDTINFLGMVNDKGKVERDKTSSERMAVEVLKERTGSFFEEVENRKIKNKESNRGEK